MEIIKNFELSIMKFSEISFHKQLALSTFIYEFKCKYLISYTLKVRIHKSSNPIFLFFKYKCIPIGICKISLANLNNEG